MPPSLWLRFSKVRRLPCCGVPAPCRGKTARHAPIRSMLSALTQRSFLIQALAQKLHLQPGDEVILRLRKPSALSREAVVSPRGDDAVSLRLKVHAIVGPDLLGNLSLEQSQSPPLNAFVNRGELSRAFGLNDKVNLL